MRVQDGWRTGAMLVCLTGALVPVGHAESAHPPGSGIPAPAAVQAFQADPEFCAYMASSPDGESASFVRRYEAAMQAAVKALRTGEASLTETAALFRLRAGCASALNRPSE